MSGFDTNFGFLPLVQCRYRYQACLLVMLVAGLLPLLWFKRKGWLWKL